MRPPSFTSTLDARVRAAWQTQMAAARQTPRLLSALVQRRQELLPRFAVCYHHLRALPRRVRRALQRQWRQSLAGVALLLALGVVPAQAGTIPVDGATCTLVNAIIAANTDTATGGCAAGSGADTIVLQNSSIHTLTTVNNTTPYGATGLPVITSPITIEGNNSTITRGSGAPDFRIFAVSSSGNLTLQETTVSGGVADGISPADRGGGVFNSSGTLTITNSTISGNMASSGGGGGVDNSGTFTLTNSTISGNTASSGGGGGVENYVGPFTMTNSTISGNTASGGGGVENYVGTFTMINSTISGNSTSFGAGGVYNSDGSTLTMTNSTISGNTASSYGGGGVETGSGSTLTITNSTITGNTASSRSGGGVYDHGGILTITRTLVSGNTASTGPEIYNSGSAVTANNLFGANDNAGVVGFSPGATDLVPSVALSAILDPTLANNGGPTLTHALVSGSPAVDAAGSGCPPPATDQRGVARPQGAACDIGAFELAAPPLAIAIGTFRPSTGQWFLDLNHNGLWDGCATDDCLGPFGLSTDLPVASDWDGSGMAKVGVFRPSSAQWFLDLNGDGLWSGCGMDGCLGPFGVSTDLPVAGDWNGTGEAKIGVFRPSTRQWFVDLNGNGTWDGCGVDGCLGPFGVSTDLPVAGDWTGTGTAKIGVFRAGSWYLDLNGNGLWDGCSVDGCLGPFGVSTDRPVAGAW